MMKLTPSITYDTLRWTSAILLSFMLLPATKKLALFVFRRQQLVIFTAARRVLS